MKNFNRAIILHYDSKLPINCHIRNDNLDNFFSAVLLDEMKLNIGKGDPVVVGLLLENGYEALGGSVVSVNMQTSARTLIIFAESKSVPIERRGAARMSTSLYGIVSKNNMVVSDICIKDISETGLCIYTNTDFEVKEQVEIDMVLQDEVGKFKCCIIRKAVRYGKKVYGLIILHDDESITALRQFMQMVQKYYADLMSISDGSAEA